ncbi:hypothetical protein J6590_071550 [Homalodisca vitripennis]|nr:hypothetical protein J6590_071550 [Homalodisca vitripennis]
MSIQGKRRIINFVQNYHAFYSISPMHQQTTYAEAVTGSPTPTPSSDKRLPFDLKNLLLPNSTNPT